MREPEGGAEFCEKPHRVRDILLLILGEGIPPAPEFVREFNFPGHIRLYYSIDRIILSTALQNEPPERRLRAGLPAHVGVG
jgi:hypothetical protein